MRFKVVSRSASSLPRPHIVGGDRLPILHGLFLAASGLWPVLHLRSFEAVTGPKQDGWLVKSVGALLTAIGASLLADGLRGARSEATRVLGIGSAAALGGADLVYSLRGRISKVYLIDAAVQAGWCAAWLRRSRSRPPIVPRRRPADP